MNPTLRKSLLSLSTLRTLNKDGFLWCQRDEFLRQLEIVVARRAQDQQMQFELVTATDQELQEALTNAKNFKPGETVKGVIFDSDRVKWIEQQSNGDKWSARQSTTGRGFRLHNSPHGHLTARAAIDEAMKEDERETGTR